MSSSFEKSVKGGTKVKMAAPKSKYVEHILTATRSGEAGVAEIFRTLTLRLRDTTWTIVFKSLIIVHMMIREGEALVTLRYIAENSSKMAVSSFSEVQSQGSNIRNYHDYLLSRAKAYTSTKLDWVRDGKGRLKKQTVDKGLLRETEAVQKQIAALIRCQLFADEPENEISLTAFRLLTMDLLILYGIMNEGAINVLEHYFEMSKVDAERALAIYKTFSRQTDEVVKYLSVARRYENATRLQIPNLKHAPTSLTSSLEEYLHDPDFEVNRRQYLAQQEAKRTGRPAAASAPAAKAPAAMSTAPTASAAAAALPKGPAPDLIDFFESIEQNQQSMNAPPQQQIVTNAIPQYQFQQPLNNGAAAAFPSTNPFASMVAPQMPQQTGFQQPGFQGNMQTGVQMGMQQPGMQQQGMQQQGMQQQGMQQQGMQQQGMQQQGMQQPFPGANQQYNPQLSTIHQQQTANFPNAQPPQTQQSSFASNSPFGLQTQQTGQSTNPFRQSMLPQTSPFQSPPPSGIQPQSTNPFARTTSPPTQSPFQSAAPGSNPFGTQQPMQPMQTGTNPFARSPPAASPPAGLVPQATGTNPFRQAAFVNQQTGQGWQAGQGTMGGLENLDTVPVFPRPAGTNPFGAPQQQWP